MNYTKGEQPKCGCIININCPLHKAAPEMYEALKDAQFWFAKTKAYIPNHSATLGTINEALAKAEGK